MKLKLHNSWQYEGDDYWSWAAYLTGDDLGRVKSVEYILHPTFRDPVRKIKDAASGFRMETNGWGTFKLKAIVHDKDGGEALLTHNIVLAKDPEAGNTEKA